MRVLITGGAGFIGSQLANHLAERGFEVVVFDNFSRGSFAPLDPRISVVRGDVRDPSALDRAVPGSSVVFHLAAQSNVMGAFQNPDESFTSNVAGTYNVLRAAQSASVSRVVFTSSREVYGDCDQLPVSEARPVHPKNAYGASKAAGEVYCKLSAALGQQITVLRLANVYGPGDRGRVIPIFVDNCLRGEPLRLYGGKQVLDLVWIGTVLDALCRAAFGAYHPGPINVGSGSGITIEHLARRVIELTGSDSRILIAPARSCEVSRFQADVRRAVELLGLPVPADSLHGLPQVIDQARDRYPPSAPVGIDPACYA